MQNSSERHFDILIVGAGVSGFMATSRISQLNHDVKIAILDREATPGGRSRTSRLAASSLVSETGALPIGPLWGYGLNGVSPQLYAAMELAFNTDPDTHFDLDTYKAGQTQTLGVLSGSKVDSCASTAAFEAKGGAKMLGGLAGMRQWPELLAILEANHSRRDAEHHDHSEDHPEAPGQPLESRDHPLSHYWKQSRRAPAAIVLEQLAAVIGIPDIWSACCSVIRERMHAWVAGQNLGSWDTAIAEWLAAKTNINFFGACRAIEASHADGLWTLKTEQGEFTAERLIVAQPPWLAITWLPKALWPSALLALTSKTRPVSAVTLSSSVNPAIPWPEDIPEVIIVPAEGVQAIVTPGVEVSFQTTIDFEVTVQAPEVVKAVKSLKRARKKFLSAYPGLLIETDHIALVPVAWPQSPAASDGRYLDRLGKASINSAHLMFCGDAYGPSYQGDENILRSVAAVAEAATKPLKAVKAREALAQEAPDASL